MPAEKLSENEYKEESNPGLDIALHKTETSVEKTVMEYFKDKILPSLISTGLIGLAIFFLNLYTLPKIVDNHTNDIKELKSAVTELVRTTSALNQSVTDMKEQLNGMNKTLTEISKTTAALEERTREIK